MRLDAVIYTILFAQLILTLSITKMYQLVKYLEMNTTLNKYQLKKTNECLKWNDTCYLTLSFIKWIKNLFFQKFGIL